MSWVVAAGRPCCALVKRLVSAVDGYDFCLDRCEEAHGGVGSVVTIARRSRWVVTMGTLALAAAASDRLAVIVSGQAQVQPAQQPPQVDLADVVRHALGRPPPDQTDSKDAARRVLFPTIGVSQAGGVAFGAIMSAVRQADADSPAASLFTITASYSTKHRTIVAARDDRRWGGLRWRLLGDWRFYDFTERTYGLGTDAASSTFEDVQSQWARAHLTLYRQVAGAFSAGAGYHLDARFFSDGRQSQSSGVSVDALYDSRDNTINAARGFFGRVSAAAYRQALGSDDDWQALQAEARVYVPIPSARRQVVAFWLYTSRADVAAPYFDLPSVGWDTYGRTARGYAAGRFRGPAWTYGEGEYRLDLLRNGLVGAVAFANASTVADASGRYGRWAPAAGFGLRLKLDKGHGGNLCLDYGWGQDHSHGLFLGLNEGF